MISTSVLTAALAAMVQMSGASQDAADTAPRVQRIEIVGARAVETAAFQSVGDPFLDRPLQRDDLRALADELSEACQKGGYMLCRADIHAQDLSDGILEVRLSEGYIERVEADPALLPILERIFRPVLKERPATETTFRRAVARLDDVPGLKVRSIRPRRLEGHGYALEVEGEYKRVGLRGLVTNRGSRRDHPWKAFAGVEYGSALMPGDQWSVGLLTRPQSPDELVFLRSRYDTAPLANGLRLFADLTASNSSPRSELDGRDVDGQLYRAEVGGIWSLLRRDGRRLDAKVSLETSYSDEEEDGLTLYEDRLHILRAGLSGRRRFGRSTFLQGQVRLSHGLDILDAGGQSRTDGEAAFTKLDFDGLFATPLAYGLVSRLGAEGQWSDSPLLFAEEFGLGGGKFGRGYDFGEVMGDHGAAGYAELARPFRVGGLVAKAEPYLYADAGTTWNEGDGLSADGTVLWSAGGGIRLTGEGGWTLSYEAAAPLSDAPYTLDDDEVRHRIDLGFSR